MSKKAKSIKIALPETMGAAGIWSNLKKMPKKPGVWEEFSRREMPYTFGILPDTCIYIYEEVTEYADIDGVLTFRSSIQHTDTVYIRDIQQFGWERGDDQVASLFRMVATGLASLRPFVVKTIEARKKKK